MSRESELVTEARPVHRQPSQNGTVATGVGDGVVADAERAEAFRSLVAHGMDASHRLATVILNDSVAAEDALHDAYLTAWRAWPSLRDPSRLEAWFRRILVNTCRDRLRRASRWHIHDISDELAIAAQDPILPIDDRLVVEQALARLRPEDRILLALRFHGDLAIADIGQALGIRNGAVASRLHRALERLRKILVDSDSKGPGR